MSYRPIQTTNTIAALKKAGFSRSGFRVRTPKNKWGEYEDTEITLLASRSEIWDRVPAMLSQGLIVMTHRYDGDRLSTPQAYYSPPVYVWKALQAGRLQAGELVIYESGSLFSLSPDKLGKFYARHYRPGVDD